MRGVQVSEFGGPEALRFREDLEKPTLGDYDVLVRNSFAGVNFKDLLLCRGDYHGGTPDLPFIPGIEAAGIIAEVGAKVDNFEVGQRVAYMTGSMASKHNQCYAEYNRVDSTGCITTIPDEVPFEVACALVIQGLTMHYLTTDCFTPEPGDTVLVHGGGGGLGQLMIARLKALGANVVTTASQDRKQDAARSQGADLIIDYTACNFEEMVKKHYPSGVRCVFDGIGKPTFLKGLSCLQKKGTMVLYGNAGGAHPEPIAPTLLTQMGSLTLMRPALYDYVSTQGEFQARLSDLFDWYEKGDINLKHLTIASLSEVAPLHEALINRKVVGKAILRV